jgi:hypothetical protein
MAVCAIEIAGRDLPGVATAGTGCGANAALIIRLMSDERPYRLSDATSTTTAKGMSTSANGGLQRKAESVFYSHSARFRMEVGRDTSMLAQRNERGQQTTRSQAPQ